MMMMAVAEAKVIIDVTYALKGKEESRSRMTWHSEAEEVLNDHVILEHSAAIQYQALYAYFARDAVNLKNTAKFFQESADEEWGHAAALMAYQIKRGGKVEIKAVDAPVHDFPGTDTKADVRVAFEGALAMEKKVYDSLLRLHNICGTHNDRSCQDYIDDYLADQIHAIDQIARYVADLNRIGTDGHAIWHWDHEVFS